MKSQRPEVKIAVGDDDLC